MYVFKFGGASVKSADDVRNVADIIARYKNIPLMIVVSAMGKTTNAFEQLTEYYFKDKEKHLFECFSKIKQYHIEIAEELFNNIDSKFINSLNNKFKFLETILKKPHSENYNFEYDRIVSIGEELSVMIISYYLNESNISTRWFHARDIIITDARYRDAQVNWDKTCKAVNNVLLPYFSQTTHSSSQPLAITQGFIGGTAAGYVTTLGREGSDYSAAILAYALNANEVLIWKDVPGLLNADPKLVKQTVLLPNISYQEAIELAYYGAKVIHPKTLKPLLTKNIPLRVKSFYEPGKDGTLINNNIKFDDQTPSYIFKFNQVLLSVSPKDFSFIAEHNLSYIFSEFAKYNVRINMMQNSAISFSVCFDFDRTKTPALINGLKKLFHINCLYDKELLTIRHYKKANIKPFIKNRKVILEQKTCDTLQLLVKK